MGQSSHRSQLQVGLFYITIMCTIPTLDIGSLYLLMVIAAKDMVTDLANAPPDIIDQLARMIVAPNKGERSLIDSLKMLVTSNLSFQRRS